MHSQGVRSYRDEADAVKRSPWSAATKARPVAAKPGRDFGARSYRRPFVGLASIAAVIGLVAAAIAQFSGQFLTTEHVTVRTDRAGLLMDVGAKVRLNGAQIGTVSAISAVGDGAQLVLALDPERMAMVPENTGVEVAAQTVFGPKSVDFVPPADPSTQPIRAGQTLDSRHVTVETNTIFERLNAVLTHIDPAKLNEALGAMSTAFGGRGESFGQSLSDFNAFLATVEPSLPALGDELRMLPVVANAYADTAPDFVEILRNTTEIGHTLIEEQSSLDRFLVASIGLADTGTDVLGANESGLSDLMRLLVPTTDLTNEYHEALTCALSGTINFALKPPGPLPGVNDIGALTLGIERYRYPGDLPKVAATGGPQCAGQLPMQYNVFPPKVLADVGTDPNRYGNRGLLWNFDLVKQLLFGPIDGPPRNTPQLGQPG